MSQSVRPPAPSVSAQITRLMAIGALFDSPTAHKPGDVVRASLPLRTDAQRQAAPDVPCLVLETVSNFRDFTGKRGDTRGQGILIAYICGDDVAMMWAPAWAYVPVDSEFLREGASLNA